LSLFVVFGWIRYDFFGGHSDDDATDLQRAWFGQVSGFAFVIIVVPWCCALVSIYGVLNMSCTLLMTRVDVFQETVNNMYHATSLRASVELKLMAATSTRAKRCTALMPRRDESGVQFLEGGANVSRYYDHNNKGILFFLAATTQHRHICVPVPIS